MVTYGENWCLLMVMSSYPETGCKVFNLPESSPTHPPSAEVRLGFPSFLAKPAFCVIKLGLIYEKQANQCHVLYQKSGASGSKCKVKNGGRVFSWSLVIMNENKIYLLKHVTQCYSHVWKICTERLIPTGEKQLNQLFNIYPFKLPLSFRLKVHCDQTGWGQTVPPKVVMKCMFLLI